MSISIPNSQVPTGVGALGIVECYSTVTVPDLENHAARAWGIHRFRRVADPSQSHTPDHFRLILVEADRALHQRNLDATRFAGFFLAVFFAMITPTPRLQLLLLSHAGGGRVGGPSACGARQRSRAPRCAGSPNRGTSSSTFEIPADSTTARTAPPAMIPVPSGQA